MKEKSPKITMAFIIVGPLIFFLYLYFFIGFNDIVEVFKQVNPYEYLFWYSLTFVALMLGMLFYSMSWNTLMKALSINVSIKHSFIYCALGIFVDLIIPLETISGEITRIYFIHKETGDPPGKIIASVAVHRIITTLITLGSLLFSSIVILKYGLDLITLSLMAITVFGSFLLIAILLYLSLREHASKRLISFLIRVAESLTRGRFDFSEIMEKAQHNILYFHRGFKSFKGNFKPLIKSIIYSFLAWLLHVSIYLLVFYSLGFSEISMKFYETIVVYSVSMALQSIPIALPAGLVEVVMTSLYTLLGVPMAISGIATLFIRITTFWSQIIIGYIIAQFIGVKNLLKLGGKETSI